MLVATVPDLLPENIRQELVESAKELPYMPAYVGMGHPTTFRQASIHIDNTWEGFRLFWDNAKYVIQTYASYIQPMSCSYPTEMQVTWSKQGDFMNAHIDSGQGEIKQKRISFVWYMEVSNMEGGELCIGNLFHGDYREFPYGNNALCDLMEIRPITNMLIMYDSWTPHYVKPVRGKDACRRTINGWSF